MQRQCAWCLRLMDSVGEPISSIPVPKIHKASHGMCKTCGDLWLEQALQDTQPQAVARPLVLDAKVSSHYEKDFSFNSVALYAARGSNRALR